MKFLDTILMLVAVSAVVFSAYFVGHALSSEHPGWAWATAAGLLLFGAALGAFTARRLRRYPRHHGDVHAH